MKIYKKTEIATGFFAILCISIIFFTGMAMSLEADPANTADKTATRNIDTPLKKCTEFLANNNLAERPAITCAGIIKKEINCAEFLKSKNIEDAESKCKAFVSTAAAAKVVNRVQPTLLNRKGTTVEDHVMKKYPEARNFVEGLPDEKANVLAKLGRAEQKKILALPEPERLEKLEKYKIKPVEKEMLFKKRIIAKDKLNDAKKEYAAAKKEYSRVNDIYKDKKEKFIAVKDKLKKCSGNKTDECIEYERLAINYSKEYIINGARMAIEHLTKIKSSVESADGMDEDRANEIISLIDSMISELNAAISKVEAAETKDDVIDAAKEISKIWTKIKHVKEIHAARVINAATWNIIKKSEMLEKRLAAALLRLNKTGKNIDDINQKIDDFSEKISTAKEKYNEAENLLNKAKNITEENGGNMTDEARELVKQAKESMNAAHNNIKEAYKILASILREINAAGGAVKAESDDDYEVEENESGEDDDDNDDTNLPPAQNVTDTTLETIDLSTIDSADCWKNKPAYTPGENKGYFIWQGTCANFWWIDWSGDTKKDISKLIKCIKERRKSITTSADVLTLDIEAVEDAVETAEEIVNEAEEDKENESTNKTFCSELTLEQFKELKKKLLYPVEGNIKSNGKIFDVGTRRFDGNDRLKFKDNEISFKAKVGPNFDGIFFRTTGDKVTFDLTYDGEKSTELVYIGKEKENPSSNPFELDGTTAKGPTCRSSYMIYNKRCTNRIKNEFVKADGLDE